jgi:hypothetical protein
VLLPGRVAIRTVLVLISTQTWRLLFRRDEDISADTRRSELDFAVNVPAGTKI